MTGPTATGRGIETPETPGVCRCEATIPLAILEGYACGRPECWRTPVAQASFDAFVAELIASRDESR